MMSRNAHNNTFGGFDKVLFVEYTIFRFFSFVTLFGKTGLHKTYIEMYFNEF